MTVALLENRMDAFFRLRPYQEQAVSAVLREWEADRLATLLNMAVGTGKTEVFLSVLAAELAAGRLERALILAHRQELVQQPAERVECRFPMLFPIGIVQAERDESHAQVMAATVQTVSQPKRLERLLSIGTISHLVVDEAHHGVAETYMRVADRLREANPDLRILGTTATPGGGSGARGLGGLFQSVAFSFTLRMAIRAKVLVPFEAHAVELPVSFRDVPVSGGDWQDEAAGEVMKRPDALVIVVKAWKQHGGDRQTLAFTSSVSQALELGLTFKNAGIVAEVVSGGTPKAERAGIVERFKTGETRVLVNCQVFTEGVDLPMCSCLVQARPTRSDHAYVQMLGRVLRQHPGKTDAIVLDFVPKDARRLYSSADLRETLPGMPGSRPTPSTSFAVLADGQEVDGTPEELRLRLLDYLSAEPLAWKFDGQLASTQVGPGQTAAVVTMKTGEYALYLVQDREAWLLMTKDSWEEAVEETRRLVDDADKILADRKTPWRRQPASEKQEELLRKMGLWEADLTKGEAAEFIAHEFARRAVFRR